MIQEWCRRGLSLKFVVMVAVLCSSSSSFAITLLEDDRFVYGYNNGTGQHDFYTTWDYPSQPFADFNNSRQTSFVTSGAFGGSGSNSAFGDSGRWGYRLSTFDVTFDVAESTLLDLHGFFSGNSYFDTAVTLYAGSSLSDTILFSFSDGMFLDGETADFEFSDVLSSGQFRLVIELLADHDQLINVGFLGGQNAHWNFSADFRPVPIPAMGWLMGIVVVGLWKWGRP